MRECQTMVDLNADTRCRHSSGIVVKPALGMQTIARLYKRI